MNDQIYITSYNHSMIGPVGRGERGGYLNDAAGAR